MSVVGGEFDRGGADCEGGRADWRTEVENSGVVKGTCYVYVEGFW